MKNPGIVRRIIYLDGKLISEIERRTGLTRKTTRLWADASEPKYRRRVAVDAKTARLAAPDHAPDIDPRRRNRYGCSVLQQSAELRADRLNCGYSRIADFV